MKTVSNATVPDTIGFTTHGQFYQHLKKWELEKWESVISSQL
jgi:hypothetical protein